MTRVELLNLSLARLGVGLVVSMGDAALPASQFGGLLYQPTLDRALRDFPWCFAEREIALAETGDSPENAHFRHTYVLPSDCVRIVAIKGPTEALNAEFFRKQGRKLHCNEDAAVLVYITNLVEPDDMEPDFRDAFVTLLASELAGPLIQDPRLAASLLEHYETVARPKAERNDGRENASRENAGLAHSIARSPLIQRRFSGAMPHSVQGYGDLPMPE